jgi:hypothetical protein
VCVFSLSLSFVLIPDSLNFEVMCVQINLRLPKSSQITCLQVAYAQRRPSRKQKKDNAAACLCFLNYLAFLRQATDRAVSILPWVVSRGRSCGFHRADSSIQKDVRKDNPTPAYSPVSDRRRLTALVEVHWT